MLLQQIGTSSKRQASRWVNPHIITRFRVFLKLIDILSLSKLLNNLIP